MIGLLVNRTLTALISTILHYAKTVITSGWMAPLHAPILWGIDVDIQVCTQVSSIWVNDEKFCAN